MHARLRGFGFQRLESGVWVRSAEPNHSMMKPYLRRLAFSDEGTFWKKYGYFPVIAVTVLDKGRSANVTLYYRDKGTRIVENADKAQMVEAVQKLIDEHRIRGKLPNWWHEAA